MFKTFKKEIQDSFKKISKSTNVLFTTNVDKDVLWETYLNSFTDPDERQYHNCNCCRQFIRYYASIVTVVDNKLVSLWDFVPSHELYNKTVLDLNAIVTNSPIKNRLVTESTKLGTNSNVQVTPTSSITWDHFHIEAPSELVTKRGVSIDTTLSVFDANKSVFKRSLEEISIDSIESVLDLISQNSLYKGDEFKGLLNDFLKSKKEFELSTDKDTYAWMRTAAVHQSQSKIRNSSIGTLLIDLSEGKDLDHAVNAFERMVAPSNYKRPTALVSKGMIEAAEKSIAEMGIMDSLGRRFAVPEDISVNNLLYVNRDAKKALGIFEELKEDVPVNSKTLSKVEEVTIDKFITDILPNVKSLEVLVENKHLNNLVSLIAPVNKEAPSLFKWKNSYSWSYVNALTDSIKEQVKAAGGNVNGELRVSLSWFNYDDLDLHVEEPNGNVIYFGHCRKPQISNNSGQLDVDMNAGAGDSRNAVENITWSDANKMLEGTYIVKVNNFEKREAKDFGFDVEIECRGEVATFTKSSALSHKSTAEVVRFTYSKIDGIKFDKSTSTSMTSKEKWGLSTNKFQKVSMIMNSPNHWESNVGNKHLFFMLDGTHNDEIPRGFFNEFLSEELDKNRRVFEILGGKLKVESSDKQLSGVGFSTTQRNSIICKVEGKFKRTIKINF